MQNKIFLNKTYNLKFKLLTGIAVPILTLYNFYAMDSVYNPIYNLWLDDPNWQMPIRIMVLNGATLGP